MMSREKTFIAIGVPSEKSSHEQVKQFMQSAGFREILIEDDGMARLVATENMSLNDVREKLSNCGEHKLLVMPEVIQNVSIKVSKEWWKALDDCGIKLKEILHQIDVEISYDDRLLSGSYDEINRAVKQIERCVCSKRAKMNAYHNGHSDNDNDSRNATAKEFNTKLIKLNGTDDSNTVTKSSKGITNHSDHSTVDDDDQERLRPSVSQMENGTKVVREMKEQNAVKENEIKKHAKMEELNGMKEGNETYQHEEENVESPFEVDTKSESYRREKINDDELVNFPFDLQDYQLKFIEFYYPDIYAEVKNIDPKLKVSRGYIESLQSIMEKLRIHELKKFNVKLKDTDVVHFKALPSRFRNPNKILIEFSSQGMEAIGLQEDVKRWWTEVNEELESLRKPIAELKSIVIDNHHLKFIKRFYSEVYEFVESLQLKKTSNYNIQISGKSDDINKLSDWLKRHDIHLIESQLIKMPAHISENEIKTILNSTSDKLKLLINMLHDGSCEVTGSSKDIRLFKSEIEEREKAIMTSLTFSKTSSFRAANKNSEMQFEFRAPQSSIEIIIAKGNLTKQNTEAIVSPSNSQLKPLGGAAKAIADSAGYQLMDECSRFIRTHGLLRTTEVMHTSAGRMYPPVRYVIHACGPIDSNSRKLEEELEKTFIKCFKCAEELHVKSLSVPSISSGTFRVKKDVVAKCAWNALMLFDEEITSNAQQRNSLKQIRFINIDTEATESLIKTFKNRWNEYQFNQRIKTETASSEKPTNIRRSGSFSGSINSFIRESNSAKTSINEKRSTESPETSPTDIASKHQVPKIKSTSSSRYADSLESKCGVCLKPKSASGLMKQISCPHKCCVLCLGKKCLQCMNSTKLSSGSHSVRNPVQSPPPTSDEDDRKLSVSSGSTGSRRRSSSVSDRSRNQLREISDSDENRSFPIKANKSAEKDDDGDCCICMDTIKNAKKLDCGHTFCKDCIERAFVHQPKCPSCGKIYGLLKGNQPAGTMTVKRDQQLELSGYRGHGTIIITYNIPDGIQESNHPNPGKRFRGTKRIAYLPGNSEGEDICRLLQKAFDAKLIFTIGTSNTTGRDNVVVWNDIHHKTDVSGQYGYPDSTYLKRVREELAAKGIKSESSASSSSSAAAAAATNVDSRKTDLVDSTTNKDYLKTGKGELTGMDYSSREYSTYQSLPVTLNSVDEDRLRATASAGYGGSSSLRGYSVQSAIPSTVSLLHSSRLSHYDSNDLLKTTRSSPASGYGSSHLTMPSSSATASININSSSQSSISYPFTSGRPYSQSVSLRKYYP